MITSVCNIASLITKTTTRCFDVKRAC
uniref:Uncharacterized protein n=1 Tax=Arundo donax TaxID=35708 RepID=A0A0A8Y2Y4_ARUDO